MRQKKDKTVKNGFVLIEIMVVVLIFSIVTLGLYTVFSTGQVTWYITDTSIEIQQDLRKTLGKVTRELHESGFDKNGVSQVTISDGGGINGTDILRFSMPIICESGSSIIDANGDIAYWGAPLTWGCTSSSCMDADNDCATTDYLYVEYLIDNANQLIRRVLDDASAMVREDIFAQNIVDFQATKSVDQNVVTLQITAQKKSLVNKIVTASTSMEVYLRNRG